MTAPGQCPGVPSGSVSAYVPASFDASISSRRQVSAPDPLDSRYRISNTESRWKGLSNACLPVVARRHAFSKGACWDSRRPNPGTGRSMHPRQQLVRVLASARGATTVGDGFRDRGPWQHVPRWETATPTAPAFRTRGPKGSRKRLSTRQAGSPADAAWLLAIADFGHPSRADAGCRG